MKKSFVVMTVTVLQLDSDEGDSFPETEQEGLDSIRHLVLDHWEAKDEFIRPTVYEIVRDEDGKSVSMRLP